VKTKKMKAPLLDQLQEGLDFMKDLEAGKVSIKTLRTTHIVPSIPEYDAKQIKRLRENDLHVSQAVLASALGVSPRTVQAWEIGKNKPSGAAAKLLQLLERRPSIRKDLIAV